MKKNFDAHDRHLVATLTEDGQMSVGKVSERLGVTAPTVRSRLRNLITAGAVRVAALVNPMKAQGLTVALVGMSLQSTKMLDEKLENISQLDRVNWCAAVTGRYDIIVEITCTNDMGDLYDFLDKDLSQIGGINSSESFVVMKSKRKWLYLPEAVTRVYEK